METFDFAALGRTLAYGAAWASSTAVAIRVRRIILGATVALAAVAACDKTPPRPATASTPQGPVSAPPTDTGKVAYELQEKCARDAYELYRHEWIEKPQGNLRTINLTYTNHYNSKLGKCFVVVTFLYADTSKSKITDYETEYLVDVLENREIGSFLMPMKPDARALMCYVGEQSCQGAPAISASHTWESLAKPYMEE